MENNNPKKTRLILRTLTKLKPRPVSLIYSLEGKRLVKKAENLSYCDKFHNKMPQNTITKTLTDCHVCFQWYSGELNKTGNLMARKEMEANYNCTEEINGTLLGYSQDDFKEKTRMLWDIIPTRGPSMREAISTLKSPQGRSGAPEYRNEATHRGLVNKEGDAQLTATKWIMENPGEHTAPETATLLLRASTLSLVQIMQVYVAIKAQTKVDFELEQLAFQEIEKWLRQNIMDGGDKIGLLDFDALGGKRERRGNDGGQEEGEIVVMEAEETNKWIGVTWAQDEEAPEEAKQKLAARLDSLLEEILPIEVEYRRQIMEQRGVAIWRTSLGLFAEKVNMETLDTCAVLITGIPTGISSENLGNALHLITHVNGLPMNAEQTFVSINEGTWSRYPNKNLTNTYVTLEEVIRFSHNSPRRTNGEQPMVCEVKDLLRFPEDLERKGKNKGAQTWYAQGVYQCRLDNGTRYTEVALVRGLRFSGGALEDSFAILMSHINEATEQVRALFPKNHPMLCEIRQRMNWFIPPESGPDQRLSGAPEIYVQLSVLNEGDEVEYSNQLRHALLRGESAKQALRQGVNFMFCANSLTRQFTSPYPPSFVEAHVGALSVISCVKSTIHVVDVLKAMVQTGVKWQTIVRVAFFRQLPFVQETGARVPLILEDGRIDHQLSDICLIYWVPSDGMQQTGHIPDETLEIICEVNAHGDPHGSHSEYPVLEPGLEHKRAENNVMWRIESGKGLTPLYGRANAVTKKKLPGGATQVGGLTLRKYVSHESTAPPNTPGSKTSTPVRTPSVYSGNKSEGSPSAGGGGLSAAARPMANWLSPPPRVAGAKESNSEGHALRAPPPLNQTTFPPLNSTRVATMYDDHGRAQLISTKQLPSSVAAPGAFSFEALKTLIQGEREITQTLVRESTAPLLAQIAILTAEAKQAKEESARTLRDFQTVQERNVSAAFASGFQNMLNPSFFSNLASAINAQQQQTATPAPQKDEDEA